MSNEAKAACEQCGTPFTKQVWFRRFCTEQCRLTWHRDRRRRALDLLANQERRRQ